MRQQDDNPFKNYHSLEFNVDESLSFEQRLAIVKEMGMKAKKDFDEKYPKINNWLNSDYDQTYILAYCLRYFLMGEKGYDEEAATGSLAFPPHYLEILQALSLSHSRKNSAKPLWVDVHMLKKDMKEIGKLTKMLMFDFPNVRTKNELKAYLIRMDMMGYNIAVRNWAYYHQMQSVTYSMAALVENDFLRVYNASSVEFMKLLFVLCDKMAERLNIHIDKVRSALSKQNYIKIQEEYERVFKYAKKSNKIEKEHFWNSTGKDLRKLRMALLAHSDLELSNLLTFSIDEMVSYSDNQLSKESILFILNKLSFEFGELKDSKQEHIILDNPVHNRPFIKIGHERYFTSIWTIIPHLSISMLEYLVQEDDTLRDRYNDSRGDYLEDEVEALFRKSFPHASIYRGSMFHGSDGKVYENDLLVLIGSFALVVESKAGSVTKAAKRGAPGRLFETLKELIEEPSDQALRFIDYLKANKGEISLLTKKKKTNEFNTDKINYFIPLGVTFYHLGVAGTNLKLLVEGDITKKQINELAPSISLTDLQIVFDILTSDAQKIHYLQRRRELEYQADYIGDELDMLGFYLDAGFNIGGMESLNNYKFDLSLKSKSIDPYIVTASEGVTDIAKPSLKMTQWWKDVLDRIAERKVERWLEFSYVLLNLHIEDQKRLRGFVDDIVIKTKNRETTLKHNWGTLRTISQNRQFSIVGYPYEHKYIKERNDIFNLIIDKELKDNSSLKAVVIIGIDIDNGGYPYSVLSGYFSKSIFDDRFASAIQS